MKINAATVKNVFEGVLRGQISRHDADRWAASVLRKDEVGEVEFIPASDEQRILAGIRYLFGVDLKHGPDDDYLDDDEGVRAAMMERLELE